MRLTFFFFFFFNDTATTEIYTLSLHDALPICLVRFESSSVPTTLPTAYDVYPLDGRHDGGYYTVKDCVTIDGIITTIIDRKSGSAGMPRPISYPVFCLKKTAVADFLHNGRQHVIMTVLDGSPG